MELSKKIFSFVKGMNRAYDISGSNYVKRKQDNTLLLALLFRNNASLRIGSNFTKIADKLNSKRQITDLGLS